MYHTCHLNLKYKYLCWIQLKLGRKVIIFVWYHPLMTTFWAAVSSRPTLANLRQRAALPTVNKPSTFQDLTPQWSQDQRGDNPGCHGQRQGPTHAQCYASQVEAQFIFISKCNLSMLNDFDGPVNFQRVTSSPRKLVINNNIATKRFNLLTVITSSVFGMKKISYPP